MSNSQISSNPSTIIFKKLAYQGAWDVKGIKQHHMGFYPVLETCYDIGRTQESVEGKGGKADITKLLLHLIFSQHFLVFCHVITCF